MTTASAFKTIASEHLGSALLALCEHYELTLTQQTSCIVELPVDGGLLY